MSVATTIQIIVSAVETNAADLVTAEAPLKYNKTYTFTDGVGADQANAVWSDTRTAAGNDDIDLSGTLTNAFGVTVQFARVKAVLIEATDAAATVGGAGAALDTIFADTSDILNIASGGMALLVAPSAAGYAVTATTADILRITMTGTYNIVVIGGLT